MKQKISNILKKKRISTFVVLMVLLSSTTVFAWLWVSNVVQDDVEITGTPITLTLVDSPGVAWRGTYPVGPMLSWVFNITFNSNVTECDFHALMSWGGYNSSVNYFGDLVNWRFNNTGWGGTYENRTDGLAMINKIYGPGYNWSHVWQAGEFRLVTFDVIIDTAMPIGNYHFEFSISGTLV